MLYSKVVRECFSGWCFKSKLYAVQRQMKPFVRRLPISQEICPKRFLASCGRPQD